MSKNDSKYKRYQLDPFDTKFTEGTPEVRMYEYILNTYSADIASCKFIIAKRKRLRKELLEEPHPERKKLLARKIQYVWSGWQHPNISFFDLLMHMTSEWTAEICDIVGGSHRAFIIQRAIDLRRHLGLNLFEPSSMVSEDLTARDALVLQGRLKSLGLATYDIDLIDEAIRLSNMQSNLNESSE